ncbi:hypothetical protein [Microvirga massiliensis]|nr:hypothetical protein [Microvirga massiliensis]
MDIEDALLLLKVATVGLAASLVLMLADGKVQVGYRAATTAMASLYGP